MLRSATTLTFESGLRVVLARTSAPPDGPIHVATYVSFGFRHDAAPGEAHFLEHVVANSPAAAGPLPTPPAGSVLLSNAITRPNDTSYLRSVTAAGLAAIIPHRLIRAGAVARSPNTVEHQRGRILEELERSRQSPGFSAYKALDAFTRDLDPRVSTEVSWVLGVQPDTLWRRIDEIYRPERAVLVIAGPIDVTAVEGMVRSEVRALGLDRQAMTPRPFPTSARIPQDGRDLSVRQNPAGVFSAAVGLSQPEHDQTYAAFLVLDQWLMGGRTVGPEGPNPARSDAAPLARALGASLGAFDVYDGKEVAWGVPALAEHDHATYAVTFSLPGSRSPADVRRATLEALKELRRTADDAELIAARDQLARFYDAWLRGRDGRVMADHLAAWAFQTRDPISVNDIAANIRAVSPAQVRTALDRLLKDADPRVVVLEPAAAEHTFYDAELWVDTAAGTLRAEVDVTLAAEEVREEQTFLLGGAYRITEAASEHAEIERIHDDAARMQQIVVRPRGDHEGPLTFRLAYEGALLGTGSPPLNVISPQLTELNLDGGWMPTRSDYTLLYASRLRIHGLPGDAKVVSQGQVSSSPDAVTITRDVEDFDLTFVAAPGLERLEGDGVEIHSATPSAGPEGVYLRHGEAALRYFENWFGPAPGRPLKVVVVDRERTSGYARRGYVVVTSRRAGGEQALAKFIAHEFAHSWSPRTDPLSEHHWLAEATAEYLALRYLEEAFGPDALNQLLAEKRERASSALPVLNGGRGGDVVLYDKGALLLFQLEDDLGRERMDQLMAAFARERPPETAAFLMLLGRFGSGDVVERFRASLQT